MTSPSDDEASCLFVSSRGILKSCSIHSSNPLSSSPTDLNHVRDFIEQQPQAGYDGSTPVSIYICCDAFNEFLQKYADKITVPHCIVCGDGDLTMFEEAVPREKHNMFAMFMLNPNMRGLFSQNMDIHKCRMFLIEKTTKLWMANATIFNSDNNNKETPKTLEEAVKNVTQKLRQIPIGLDYHTISTNPEHTWNSKENAYKPLDQEHTLIREIREVMKPFHQRKIRIYSNVMLRPDRFNDRTNAVQAISSSLIFQQTTFIPRTQTWRNMTEFAFVLSPFGNGMDCHRTWEALLCGCIPIVRSSVFNELFEGLPVLIVENWSDISLQLLVIALYDFKDKADKNELKYEKLELGYYTKMFSQLEV